MPNSESRSATNTRARFRRIARKLPILSQYEARLSEYEARIAQLETQELHQAGPAPMTEFVPAGHFYSAVPDLVEVKARHDDLLRRDPTDVPGVHLNLVRQWAVLRELERHLPSMPFGDSPTTDLRYGFRNDAFSYGDGTMLHLMLRSLRPQHVIEIGSGHSSACTLDTVDLFLDGGCELTFIEPYDELLRSLIREEDEDRVSILSNPVQDVPVDVFASLEDGDLLFIDSTHVSKVGSDVNYLFFDIIPALKPGVVVHLHDVFPRFEYPWQWIEEGRVWQEDYLLRAFLQYNEEYEVLLWPGLLAQLDQAGVFERFPTMRRNAGGSIYLRRRGGSPITPAAGELGRKVS